MIQKEFRGREQGEKKTATVEKWWQTNEVNEAERGMVSLLDKAWVQRTFFLERQQEWMRNSR